MNASGLKKADFFGKSDPYAKVRYRVSGVCAKVDAHTGRTPPGSLPIQLGEGGTVSPSCLYVRISRCLPGAPVVGASGGTNSDPVTPARSLMMIIIDDNSVANE